MIHNLNTVEKNNNILEEVKFKKNNSDHDKICNFNNNRKYENIIIFLKEVKL